MMQNVQGRWKMEFPQCNCFPAINHKADSWITCTTCFKILSKCCGRIESQKSSCFLFTVIPRARYHKNVC